MDTRRLSTLLAALLGAFLLLALLLVPARGRRVNAAPRLLFVTPAGGGDCSQADPCDLQTALAQATDGDTLYLAEGTYTGSGASVITATHTLTIYGGWDGGLTTPPVRDPDHHPTVLDGEGVRRAIVVYLPITLTLDGLQLVRGNASTAPVHPNEGGALFSIYGTPLIAHCLISGNVASTGTAMAQGGGIHIANPRGWPIVEENRFISNAANLAGWGTGGGLSLLSAPYARVADNLFLSNTATLTGGRGYGGGIAVSGVTTETLVVGNEMRGNVAVAAGDGHSYGYGGGLMASGPGLQILDNLILSNTAILSGGIGYGGGIALNDTMSCTLEGNRIEYNVAQRERAISSGGYGGGLYAILGHHLMVRGNRIRMNTASLADRGEGGGIALWWHCDNATLADNVIEYNVAATGIQYGYGGGLYLYSSLDLNLEANRIRWNQAGGNTSSGGGGGIYLWRNISFTMTNNLVVGNRSTASGAGMKFDGWVAEPITGTLVHNTFAGNETGAAPGIALYLHVPRVTLMMTNNLIADHSYGIYAESETTATLDHTLFYANGEGETGGDGTITSTAAITGEDPCLTAGGMLQGGGAAINAASTLPWVTVDIEGDPRPFGAAADIGADEYIGTVALPLILKNR